MINRTMRILIMFDLPTTSKRQKKEYSMFRKHLVENGFSMLQYSIYCRVCPNHDTADKYIERIKKKVPSTGAIRALKVTEKQYNNMVILLGDKMKEENYLFDQDFIKC